MDYRLLAILCLSLGGSPVLATECVGSGPGTIDCLLADGETVLSLVLVRDCWIITERIH